MNEKNQFYDSKPVDDTTFRLTDGDWEDFPTDFSARSEDEPDGAPATSGTETRTTRSYESQIVDV